VQRPSFVWNRIVRELDVSRTRFRALIDRIPEEGQRANVKIFDDGEHKTPHEIDALLFGEEHLPVRTRSALTVLAKSMPSWETAKESYSVTGAQLLELFHFSEDLKLEVASIGALALSATPPRVTAQIGYNEGLNEVCFSFHVLDQDGYELLEPSFLGGEQGFLLAKDGRLFSLYQQLSPRLLKQLLQSGPVPLRSLHEEDPDRALLGLAHLGVELDELAAKVAKQPEHFTIHLRAFLVPQKNQREIVLRLHLVSELSYGGATHEVEIAAQAKDPCVTYCKGRSKEGDGVLLVRPKEEEHIARECVLRFGLKPSSSHRGFEARGAEALSIIVGLTRDKFALPAFVQKDTSLLPRVAVLPEKLKIEVREEHGNGGRLNWKMGVPSELGDFNISRDALLAALTHEDHALALSDELVAIFSPSFVKCALDVCDVLGINQLPEQKSLSMLESALLLKAWSEKIILEAGETLKQRLLSFIPELTVEDKTMPRGLQTALRPYQHDGVQWLSQLHRAGLSRLLADDMGLGKTLMVLTLLQKVKEREGLKPSLVVAPTSVIDIWEEEARKHVPSLKVLRWHGPERQIKKELLQDVDLIVTSYAIVRIDAQEILSKIPFRYVILDEAQAVKNPQTKSVQTLQMLVSEQRLALTGTPIENRLEDLFSIIDLLHPGLLGTRGHFERYYQRALASGHEGRAQELRLRVHPLILRRKKRDVESDLPPKIESLLRCDMSQEQIALYKHFLLRTETELASVAHGQNQAIPLIALLTRLRQICCDPRLLPHLDGPIIPSAKLELFKETMAECLAAGRRIIVYTQFVKMQPFLNTALKELGVTDALWLHGATKNRAEIVSKFQDENGPRVIFVSLKAGGTGITLTRADTVLFYDPWWNPAVEEQAADRAHRIGQTKTVHVIKLVCKDSIEEQILALCERKKQTAESVLSTDKPGQRALTMEEIKHLLNVEVARLKDT
jgi:superfamily II DNA or RNA helicase